MKNIQLFIVWSIYILCAVFWFCLFYAVYGTGGIINFWQNILAISLGSKIMIMMLPAFATVFLTWLITSLLIKFEPKTIFKRLFIFLLVLLILFFVIEIYRTIELVFFFKGTNYISAALKYRYGNYKQFENILESPREIDKKSQDYKCLSPKNKYQVKYNEKLYRHEIIEMKTGKKIFIPEHWTICPAEFKWLQENFIVYNYAYDRDDLSKIYIANLRTKQTFLLANNKNENFCW